MGVFEKSSSGILKSQDDEISYNAAKEIIEESPYLEKLILRRDKIMDKLDEYPDSEFTEIRKNELSPILKQIEQLEKNLRKNIRKISKEQYSRLPLEIKEIVNLLNF